MTIASEISRLQNAKSAIKSAIEAKLDGDTIPSSIKLDGYPTYIAQIEQGGGASVPYLPDTLVMSTQKTSDYYTPAYVGTYTKQNTPSDWTDTYYRKPPVGSQYDPVSPAYYMCCAESNGEYVWFVTTVDPSGNGDPLSAIQEMSVYSEVPIAPQDVRWTNDTVENETVIIIVEDSAGDTTPSGGGGGGDSGGGGGSTDVLTVSGGPSWINGTYTLNTSDGRWYTANNDELYYYNNYWYLHWHDEASVNYSFYDTSGSVSTILGTHDWNDMMDQGMYQSLTVTASGSGGGSEGDSGGGGGSGSTPNSVVLTGDCNGTYTKTSDTCNGHAVYRCTNAEIPGTGGDTGTRELFVVHGLMEDDYQWVVGASHTESVDMDVPMVYELIGQWYSSLSNVPENPVNGGATSQSGNYYNPMMNYSASISAGS